MVMLLALISTGWPVRVKHAADVTAAGVIAVGHDEGSSAIIVRIAVDAPEPEAAGAALKIDGARSGFAGHHVNCSDVEDIGAQTEFKAGTTRVAAISSGGLQIDGGDRDVVANAGQK